MAACGYHNKYSMIQNQGADGINFNIDQQSTLMTAELQTVCPGEQQTTLMCTTNHIFLEWSVSTISRQPETRSIPYLDQNLVISQIMINSANFTFSRVSPPMALPLVSIMTIMNINSNLEGTMVSCTGLNSSSVSSVVLMTTIHIYDIDTGRFRLY